MTYSTCLSWASATAIATFLCACGGSDDNDNQSDGTGGSSAGMPGAGAVGGSGTGGSGGSATGGVGGSGGAGAGGASGGAGVGGSGTAGTGGVDEVACGPGITSMIEGQVPDFGVVYGSSSGLAGWFATVGSGRTAAYAWGTKGPPDGLRAGRGHVIVPDGTDRVHYCGRARLDAGVPTEPLVIDELERMGTCETAMPVTGTITYCDDDPFEPNAATPPECNGDNGLMARLSGNVGSEVIFADVIQHNGAGGDGYHFQKFGSDGGILEAHAKPTEHGGYIRLPSETPLSGAVLCATQVLFTEGSGFSRTILGGLRLIPACPGAPVSGRIAECTSSG